MAADGGIRAATHGDEPAVGCNGPPDQSVDGAGGALSVPFLPSASDGLGRLGVVRVINHSDEAGEVRIDAIDDGGDSYGPVVLSVEAGEAVQFNSEDLENGDAQKGLSDGVDAGEGAWRLEMSSGLNIEVLAYVRSADGVFTAMHDTVPSEAGRHHVAFFNPGSNTGLVSRLRLVNPGEEAAEVSIAGVDDGGASPGSEVTTTVPAGAARTFTATDLESGGAGLDGALGDGEGKWRLTVESAQPLVAMSLLSDAMGRLTNLSTSPGRESQNTADLVVVSPSVSNARPVAGAAFTLSATVRNTGDGAAPATTLSYYRSPDAKITRSDTVVGTSTVAELAALGSVGVSVDPTAPSSPGTYYYGACLDAAADETNTPSKCTPSVQITVRETRQAPQGQPDLVVGTPSVSNAAPAAGATFTLSVTVRNTGDGAAPDSWLLVYYLSLDAKIDRRDRGLSATRVFELAPTTSNFQTTVLAAPLSPGTYYYGACVREVTGETNTANNCSSSVRVVVETLQPGEGQPDLVVEALSVNTRATTPRARLYLSARVRNTGNGTSPATRLQFYRSGDPDITERGAPESTAVVVSVLGAAGTSWKEIVTLAPSPGTYYYSACVGEVTGETNTTNNCSSALQVTVRETGQAPQDQPDLVVGRPSVNDNSLAAEAAFTLSATVRNAGNASSSAATLRYYRSLDARIERSDLEVDTDAVAELAAAGSAAVSTDLAAPSIPGRYYYGACVDEVTDESTTWNNCSSSVQVVVQPPQGQGQPDLVVGSPSVSDATLAVEEAFTLSATVSNTGAGASPATRLRYYRSLDTTIGRSDTGVDTSTVVALAASASADVSVDLPAPSFPGTYYYGACVDAVASETNTTNNCSVSVRVTVVETPAPQGEPDLVVATPSVSDTSPVPRATFTLTAAVRNSGEGASPNTWLRVYRSTDTLIGDRSDLEVGKAWLPALAPAADSSETISLYAPWVPGPYYYGICVDAVTDETNTANNCSSSVQVTVEPDLLVLMGGESLNDPPAAGEMFTVVAILVSLGGGGMPATTLRFYRSLDETMDSSDTPQGETEVGADTRDWFKVPRNVTAPTTPGTYYYGACVDAVAGEANTANNCSQGERVDIE